MKKILLDFRFIVQNLASFVPVLSFEFAIFSGFVSLSLTQLLVCFLEVISLFWLKFVFPPFSVP